MSRQSASLIERIFLARNLNDRQVRDDFLYPDYDKAKHDPFLLPDMDKAIDRLKLARQKQEQITIYGDYDVDGITSTVLLLDALPKFGFKVNSYTPDRFKEGYGMNIKAIEKLKSAGTDLILTVDNGIVAFDEVKRANQLGIDVIITDHHTPSDKLPGAIAVVDPKICALNHPKWYDKNYCLKCDIKKDKAELAYPFLDLCGCGVAFKLVQALQMTYKDCLPAGQEKWLLDLVALGTISDVVSLLDENRAYTKWGLEVIKKTRRIGLKALMIVSGLDVSKLDSRSVGFILGPRLNASGRLEHAELAIKLLLSKNRSEALSLAKKLDGLNSRRKQLQANIYKEAAKQIKPDDSVAVAIGQDWHEGVIGIVASKIEEAFERPAFVFSSNGKEAKGSGRSFGDFSIVGAIANTKSLLLKGGGHLAAGGLTVNCSDFYEWKKALNEYYQSLKLTDQIKFLYPDPDVEVNNFSEFTAQLIEDISRLEPFGQANPVPVFQLKGARIASRSVMGKDGNHVRYVLLDKLGNSIKLVVFNAADRFTLEPCDINGSVQYVDALVELTLNEWQGVISVEGRLIKMDLVDVDS